MRMIQAVFTEEEASILTIACSVAMMTAYDIASGVPKPSEGVEDLWDKFVGLIESGQIKTADCESLRKKMETIQTIQKAVEILRSDRRSEQRQRSSELN